VDEGAASRNANDVLMLRAQLKSLEERAVITNKSVLKAEKERDKFQKELDLIDVKVQGKRARTHDNTGDGHDMHVEIDEWDLRDFRRETTRVQNRRNVALGSLHDQPKPPKGKDGFLLHVRLGLVGWISYWCNGDSALTMDVLVELINTLGLTELVSDALGSRKKKEGETNAKIVDLLKHTLDETKNCRNEQQRVEFHIALVCVMPARETQGTNNGWIVRIGERLGLKRGKRSQKNGGRPYASDQTVDIRVQFNKDVELLQQSLKVGDRVLSDGHMCELTQSLVEAVVRATR
jgi:hypothetical protein